MYDYHHFNRPDLLENHFKEKDKRDPFQDLDVEPAPKEVRDMVAGMSMSNRLAVFVVEASQLALKKDICFMDAVDKVKEKYLK